MSKERKDDISKKNILQKVVKLVMGLLITTLIALVIWRLYGKIDIKKTDFSKVNIKKQEPTIYDMFKVKNEKKNNNLNYRACFPMSERQKSPSLRDFLTSA